MAKFKNGQTVWIRGDHIAIRNMLNLRDQNCPRPAVFDREDDWDSTVIVEEDDFHKGKIKVKEIVQTCDLFHDEIEAWDAFVNGLGEEREFASKTLKKVERALQEAQQHLHGIPRGGVTK